MRGIVINNNFNTLCRVATYESRLSLVVLQRVFYFMEKVKIYKNTEIIGDDFQTYGLPKIRKDFIAKLENALMFLNYRDLSLLHSEARNKFDLRTFDGAWLIDVSLKHTEKEMFTFAPFGELQVSPEMFPNLNIKMLNLSGEVGNMSKYRFLDPKEKRGLDNYKYIFSERLALLDYGKQRWWTSEEGYGFNKMSRLENNTNIISPMPTSLKQGYFIDKKYIADNIKSWIDEPNSMYMQMIKTFHIALQLALTYDYEWSCYIKENKDSIGVRIPISPSSSKDIFQLRDLPDGKQRKSAIVNFVKEHYRNVDNSDGTDKQVLISKHLRGELKFNWRGLEVHIIPSPYDLRKIKTNKKILNIN